MQLSGSKMVIGAIVALALVVGGAAIVMAPGQAERNSMLRRDLFAQAVALREQGDLDGARRLLDRAVRSAVADPTAVRALLSIYVDQRAYEPHLSLIRKYAKKGLGVADLRIAAVFYDRGGKSAAREEMLKAIVDSGAATLPELNELMNMRGQQGRTRDAIALADTVAKRLRPAEEPPIGVALVNVYAKAGRSDDAQAFVNRWLGPGATPAQVAAIAPALVDAGAAWVVVDPLRARRQAEPGSESLYLTVLSEAARSDATLRAELTRESLASMAVLEPGPALDTELHRLFAYGDLNLAVSELGKTGLWRSPKVRPQVVFALSTKGHGAQLRNLLVADAARPGASFAQKHSAALDLVNIGFSPEAEKILRQLAVAEGPGGKAIDEYLYFNAKRTGRVDTVWATEQAKVAGAGAGDWVLAIERNASPDAALAAINRLETSPDSRLAVLKARYLGWKGDSPALHQALGEVATLKLAGAEALEMAKLSCAVSDRSALKLAARFEMEEMRRCVDRFTLDDAREARARGDLDEALAKYASVVERTDILTPQDYIDYAGTAEDRGQQDRAQTLYLQALSRLPANRRSSQLMYMRAVVLNKLDRNDEAIVVLDDLLAKWPDSTRARVLMAQLYLDSGEYQKALNLTNAGG